MVHVYWARETVIEGCQPSRVGAEHKQTGVSSVNQLQCIHMNSTGKDNENVPSFFHCRGILQTPWIKWNQRSNPCQPPPGLCQLLKPKSTKKLPTVCINAFKVRMFRMFIVSSGELYCTYLVAIFGRHDTQ